MCARVATCPMRRARPVPATTHRWSPTGISRRADTPSISCSMAGAACPRSATMMNDGQVAAVVNYLRTHFGNNYQDAVSPKDVKDVRR